MARFSERMGFRTAKSAIQIESMDADLRNSLWNLLHLHIWEPYAPSRFDRLDASELLERLFRDLWLSHFNKPLDTLPVLWTGLRNQIRHSFFNEWQWHEVYDFIEAVANIVEDLHMTTAMKFMAASNQVLEKELSAYRFVGGTLARITSPEEIREIDEALAQQASLPTVATHLAQALNHLAHRNKPDYRNSIKESISAVEAASKLITGNPKARLNQALKVLEEKVTLHRGLKKAFESLYGYTSDAEGIRHALLEEPTLTFEDAKFMLVVCSAFVNYLTAQAAKAGIVPS